MLTYSLFVIGFFFLIKGADLLVDGASSIAKKLQISDIVIGLTIVSFGTSMPELIVNIFASVQGDTGIAIGNILGSNIANILLILGISAMIYPLASKKNTVWKEIPFSFLAAFVLGVMANDFFFDGFSPSILSRGDGLIFLSFFVIFLYYVFGISEPATEGREGEVPLKEMTLLRSSISVALGLIGLTLGGKWIVDGAVEIAKSLDVSQSLIGLTIVAIGTSLPELATSATAAYKRQADIAIGNVVGSNIFNIFWILGISALIRPLPFSEANKIDVLMTLLASAILFCLMFIGKKHVIKRWQGAFMVTLYIAYITYSVMTSRS